MKVSYILKKFTEKALDTNLLITDEYPIQKIVLKGILGVSCELYGVEPSGKSLDLSEENYELILKKVK